MNSAIRARASVGVIGLATAAWAGLGWMSHLRQALTEMWWDQPPDSRGFVRNKLSDLLAILGTFLVILATLALSALSHAAPMAAALKWLGIPKYSVFGAIFQIVSILVSLLVSWLLFTWMIARLPRESVSLVESMRAGLIAAVGFELFKQVGSIYLQKVLGSPAGAAFGPVLGLMVFAYITCVSFAVLRRVGGDSIAGSARQARRASRARDHLATGGGRRLEPTSGADRDGRGSRWRTDFFAVDPLASLVIRVRRRRRRAVSRGGGRCWFGVVRSPGAVVGSIRCRPWRFFGWSSLFRRVGCRVRRPG